MNRNILTSLAILLGFIFIIVAFVYGTHSAQTLPSYFPGYESGSTHIHLKHTVATLFLGIAAFIFAWFNSGPSSKQTRNKQTE